VGEKCGFLKQKVLLLFMNMDDGACLISPYVLVSFAVMVLDASLDSNLVQFALNSH
jgi:hypothetical protein